MTPHPKGSGARILLSSVFGPYAQDDQYGSRKINPMELYHYQVTREQGPFSLRMFHRARRRDRVDARLSGRRCDGADPASRDRLGLRRADARAEAAAA